MPTAELTTEIGKATKWFVQVGQAGKELGAGNPYFVY
jgi:hypothetical protein